jgi:dihydroorotate dehydrogenase
MSVAARAFPVLRPLLHALEAETAHRLTIKSLALMPTARGTDQPSGLSQHLFGLDFPNPLGLAPGFDKNAEVADAMLAQGFGFVEAGTVTPRPQAGNPKPRLFRLGADRAVINRMGFNNDGADTVAARLLRRRGRQGIVGVNIGANKDSPDRIADYAAGVARFGPLASYLTINISSPNTPGLRGLQSRAELTGLLAAANAARGKLAHKVPMLLKIAPDLDAQGLEDIARCCEGDAVDGVIVSNTTISRPHLSSAHAGEAGGLSGRPLFELSTRQLASFHVLTGGRLPLVAAGGVEDAATAFAKIEAGASLVQLYSALVYEGPGLIPRILDGLRAKLGGTPLKAFIGCRAAAIARGEEIVNGRG